MNTNQIIKKSVELEKEKNRLKEKLQKINIDCNKLMEECPHELVFKYNDNHPRKMIIDGNYYCPICSKNIELIFKNQYLDTCFKDSKIVYLDGLSLVGDTKTLLKIKQEVLNNIDFYYNSKDINEIRNKMEDALKDCQYNYRVKRKIFKI